MHDGVERRITLNDESVSKDNNENNFLILKEESHESSRGCLTVGNAQGGPAVLCKITKKDLIYPLKEAKLNLTETKRSKKNSIISVNKSYNEMSGSKTVHRNSSNSKFNHLRIRTNKQMNSVMKEIMSIGREPLTGVPNTQSPLIRDSNTAADSRLRQSKCNTEKKLLEEEKP